MQPINRIAHRYATLPAGYIEGELYRSLTVGVLQLDYGDYGFDTFNAYVADSTGDSLWESPSSHRPQEAWNQVPRLVTDLTEQRKRA